jgi:hypothetical protein
LANNLFKGAPAIRRPPQSKLLCTPRFVFLKNKGYASEFLRMIEDQAINRAFKLRLLNTYDEARGGKALEINSCARSVVLGIPLRP